MGKATSSLDPALRHNYFFLTIRVLSSMALVPILEELFWRGWLMRWLIDNRDFLKVPLGTYQAAAFWIVAVLFASEHGVYWEVGLLAGIIYNWWIIRTKNLADCILAHAITNGILAVFRCPSWKNRGRTEQVRATAGALRLRPSECPRESRQNLPRPGSAAGPESGSCATLLTGGRSGARPSRRFAAGVVLNRPGRSTKLRGIMSFGEIITT